MLSISEVAERTGLRPSALRYYEEVGLISSPARVGGRRHYPDDVLDRLHLIACVQSCGFTLAEIGSYSSRTARDQHAGSPSPSRSSRR